MSASTTFDGNSAMYPAASGGALGIGSGGRVIIDATHDTVQATDQLNLDPKTVTVSGATVFRNNRAALPRCLSTNWLSG